MIKIVVCIFFIWIVLRVFVNLIFFVLFYVFKSVFDVISILVFINKNCEFKVKYFRLSSPGKKIVNNPEFTFIYVTNKNVYLCYFLSWVTIFQTLNLYPNWSKLRLSFRLLQLRELTKFEKSGDVISYFTFYHVWLSVLNLFEYKAIYLIQAPYLKADLDNIFLRLWPKASKKFQNFIFNSVTGTVPNSIDPTILLMYNDHNNKYILQYLNMYNSFFFFFTFSCTSNASTFTSTI